MFKFCVLWVHLSTACGALLFANLGDNVTLPCFYTADAQHLSWYKQVAGEPPEIISSFYKHNPESNMFHNLYTDNKRFSVHIGERSYHLNISNVHHLDSAMYFCGETSVTIIKFSTGIFLFFKGFSHLSFLQQPKFESVQPGDSVTLNCTVHNGTTAKNIYWFKRSIDSHLEIMYINTHNGTRCIKNDESAASPAQSCVHSLFKRNVSLVDAGTYYCAVASCGEILFGKGTKLHVGEKQHDTVWAASLLVSVILNIILTCILCNMARRTHTGESHHQPSTDSQNEESDALQYAALSFKKRQRKGRKHRITDQDLEMVYTTVRAPNLD